MRSLIFYFKDHLIYSTKRIFNAIFLIFLVLCIILYYQTNLHDWFNNPLRSDFTKFIFYFISYSWAYYSIALLHGYLHKNPIIRSPVFYSRSLIFILILAFTKSSMIHAWLASRLVPVNYQYFLTRLLWLLKYPFLIFLVFLGMAILKGNFKHITGLEIRNINFKPFLLALLSLIPILFLVSFLPEFINYYPKYRSTLGIISSGLPEILFSIPYELSYGLNLFSVEIIFRGLFIFAFIPFLGKGSVYPMVGIYCLFHLGKPPLECISSIFGGYILGVIALYSRSILGGSMIHIGMAWSMEWFAWLQNHLRA